MEYILVLVKLKRKLEYREIDRPEFVSIFLEYLKLNNNLYKNVEINVQNIYT